MLFSRVSVDDLKLNTAPAWTFHHIDWFWEPTPLRDYLLWYVAGGEGEVYCDGHLYSFSEGDLTLWRPNEVPVVKRDSVQLLRLFSCHFECPVLPDNWFEVPRPFTIADFTYFVELTHCCEELWWRDTDSSKFEAKRIFLSILRLIHKETQARFFKEDGEIESVASILRVQFSRPWTLDEMADKVKLSRSQLVRRFRARYDQSPLQYLNLARLESSRRMLIETNCSLTEIAKECGFCDGPHFANAFKKQFGETPRAFRKG